MKRRLAAGTVALLGAVLACAPHAAAAPVIVRFPEGVTRGLPVLRSLAGERLAIGELTQVARGDTVESRLVFEFQDGSVYDETVVFSQRDVFTLEAYRLRQHGPSFPETVEASIDRTSGRYEVRYRSDEDSPEDHLSGRLTLPADVYSGMLSIVLKNLAPGASEIVHLLAFTPAPRLVPMLLEPAAAEVLTLGERPIGATRYLMKPQLGFLASFLLVDIAPIQCWIVGGGVPAFVKFQGPLYFMGPVWRIDVN